MPSWKVFPARWAPSLVMNLYMELWGGIINGQLGLTVNPHKWSYNITLQKHPVESPRNSSGGSLADVKCRRIVRKGAGVLQKLRGE